MSDKIIQQPIATLHQVFHSQNQNSINIVKAQSFPSFPSLVNQSSKQITDNFTHKITMKQILSLITKFSS